MSDDPLPTEPLAEDPMPSTTLVVDALPTDAPPGPPAGSPQSAPRVTAFVPALAEGVRVVLARPRVLLFLLLCSILLPMVAVLPVYESVETHLSAATPGANEGNADFLSGAPGWMLAEWMQRDPLGSTGGGHALMPLSLFSSLFGLVISAGWMSFASRDRRAHGLASFLRAGGHWFFPFLRTWLLGLPLFFGLTWVFWSTPAEWVFEQFLPDGVPSRGASENTGRWLETTRLILYMLAMLKTEILLDLARASLVVGDRSSATLAILRGIGFYFRHPLSVIGLVLLGLGFELLWVAGMHALEMPLLALVFVIPLGRITARGARHAGLAVLYDSILNRPATKVPARPFHHGDQGGEWG